MRPVPEELMLSIVSEGTPFLAMAPPRAKMKGNFRDWRTERREVMYWGVETGKNVELQVRRQQ